MKSGEYADPRYLVELNNYTRNNLDRVLGCFQAVDSDLDDPEYLAEGRLFKFPSFNLSPVVKIYPNKSIDIQLDFYVCDLVSVLGERISPIEAYLTRGSKSSYFCSKCAKQIKVQADRYYQNRERYRNQKYIRYYLEVGLLCSCLWNDPCDTLDNSHCECCLVSALFEKMSNYLNERIGSNNAYSKHLFLFIEGDVLYNKAHGMDGVPTNNLYASYTKHID